MREIYIIGTGGHSKVVLDILEKRNSKIAGFLDDDEAAHDTIINGYPVIGYINELKDNDVDVIVAIAHNPTRKKLFYKLLDHNFNLINAIHPEAIINSHVDLGTGNVIAAGAVINSNTVIEDNVIINTGATVDYDCLLEDHVHISPGVNIGGNVTVKEGAHIGIGASVLPGVTIGRNVTVGAGSVVINNLEADAVYAGVPAEKVRDV
ncbi:MAG: acetyltransferase [Halarsenatibacteraceae bacterium]